jgi:ABC-type antimicrobial peptide transport system permease subunit
MALGARVLGLALSAAAGPLVEPLLFDVPARDPLVFGSVAGALLAVAVAASVVPALRASRVNPLDVLRVE